MFVRDDTLFDWQRAAVDRWVAGDSAGPYRGTLEIFTGGGKTVIALSAFGRVAQAEPSAKMAIVVPTEALARQWIDAVIEWTSLQSDDIGLLGAGGDDTFEGHRVLVAVINSAARHLPELARPVESLMLVVDECHRAGAPTFSRVLRTPAEYRLGLSATPDREELDEHGEPLTYDEQLVGRVLGEVVYRFSLKDARDIGWLPDYAIHHHGVRLLPEEERKYEELSRRVSDLADRLQAHGIQPSHARRAAAREGDEGHVARAYVAAVAGRKDLLYRAHERGRVASILVRRAMDDGATPRILLFHERVAEATTLFEQLQEALPEATIALEHSKLSDAKRQQALADFRTGQVAVLVSVKSLVEGIDVPEADVGISVASSSSVRQRIQSLGRVLRRTFGEESSKTATMHVLYVTETVDEAIYAKEDWSDLTGEESNRYWAWSRDPDVAPVEQAGPPREPRPTEEQAWESLGRSLPESPVTWPGVLPDREYSVDTRGNVLNSAGAVIANPQGVAEMVRKVRGRAGGRFRVTPTYRLVIVWGEGEDGLTPFLVGRLDEPFGVREDAETEAGGEVETDDLNPGDTYPGPANEARGTFSLRQKRGGVIERRRGRDREFAVEGDHDPRALNARRVLSAWRSLQLEGLDFSVNELGHAWYRVEGEPRFLAEVPGGFLWPTDEQT